MPGTIKAVDNPCLGRSRDPKENSVTLFDEVGIVSNCLLNPYVYTKDRSRSQLPSESAVNGGDCKSVTDRGIKR